jgi:hypothetical protein
MVKSIGGVVLGPLAWFVAVAALGFLLGRAWPEMTAIRVMTLLTLPMLVARLVVSGLSSLVGGHVAAWVSGERFNVPLGAGVLLLIVFVPYHLTIWNNFPIWYHLSFFVSLPLLSVLGGTIRVKR